MYKKGVLVTAAIIISLALLLVNTAPIGAQFSGGAMGGSVSSSSLSKKNSGNFPYYGRPGPYYYGRDPYYRRDPCYGSSCSNKATTSGNESAKSGNETANNFFTVVIISCIVAICGLFFYLWIRSNSSYYQEENSILMLQIGLSGDSRNLQKDLKKIALSTETSTLAGLNSIVQGTISALLSCSNYWTHIYSYVDVKDGNMVNAGTRFQEISFRERGKVDCESVSNVNDVKYQVAVVPNDSNFIGQKFIVVTVLLALKGSHRLPAAMNRQSTEEALHYLKSIEIREDERVLVLWSPQDRMETMSGLQLRRKYGSLNPIMG